MMPDNGNRPLDLGGILSEIVPPKLDILGEAENSPPSVLRSSLKKDIFAEKERKAWVHNDGARCDFTSRPALGYRTGLFFLAVWRRSLYGKTLVEIKADDAMIGRVATATADLLAEVLGSNLSLGSWAVITTPKRRHLQRNFATLVSIAIADRLGLPFYEDCASCHSKQRVNAEFTLNREPSETNIIVFDDFATTGQTMLAMKRLFAPLRHNLVFVAAINNKA